MCAYELVKCNVALDKLFGIVTAIDSTGKFEVHMLGAPQPQPEILAPDWLYSPTPDEIEVLEKKLAAQIAGIRAGCYDVPFEMPRAYNYKPIEGKEAQLGCFYLAEPLTLEVAVQLSPPFFITSAVRYMKPNRVAGSLASFALITFDYLKRLLDYDCIEHPVLTERDLARPSNSNEVRHPSAQARTTLYRVFEDKFRDFPPELGLVNGDIHVIF